MMQAVILAGGLGTRLWPLTKEVPKPMVPVAGAPYLEHQLRLLAAQEIRSIVLLTGYLGDQIEAHFGDGSRWGLRIAYSREREPIGTGGALRDAAALLDEHFLVIYGDSLLPVDYRSVLLHLRETGAEGVVVVYDNRRGETTVRNNIALRPDGFVARYEKRAADDPELTHVEAGVLAFRREVAGRIAPGVVSLEQDVFPVLIREGKLAGFETAQRFYDIGTPDRLRAIEEYLKNDHHADAVSN